MLASIAGVAFGTLRASSVGAIIGDVEMFCGPKRDLLTEVDACFRHGQHQFSSHGGMGVWPGFLHLRMLLSGITPGFNFSGLLGRHVDPANPVSLN
ncbi:hypothetical protein [Congregicoccus parvus]|uniref:hypothetical protein n=1 Tax=Congregicoccus parvus TaxID=3081749 RepID=UPI003FA56AE3